jgi:predicted RecA/RadA family phage recombinase
MSYSRPGKGTHVVNDTGADLAHNQPAKLQGFVGVVVKQKAAKWSDGLAAATPIPNGQKCWMITKGIVQVDNVAGFAKGDPVYITNANVLTETATSNTKFGVVIEVVGDGRSVPTGKVRIDLDLKSTF